MISVTAHWWGRGREKTGAVVAGDGAEFIKQEGTTAAVGAGQLAEKLATSVNGCGSVRLVNAVTFPNFFGLVPYLPGW